MESEANAAVLRAIADVLCKTGGLMLVAGCLGYLAFFWATAPRWESVTGTVVSREIVTHARSGTRGSSTHRPELTYTYRVGGQDYRSRRIGDSEVSRNYYIRSLAVRAIDSYPLGPVTVYYDPTDPRRSALDTSLLNIFVIMAGGFGLLLATFGVRMSRKDPTAQP